MALVRSILFVDGENLTMRYQSLLKIGRQPQPTVVHRPDIFLWNSTFGSDGVADINTDILRVNYYTSAVGDDVLIEDIRGQIASQTYCGSGNYYGSCQLYPRVYKKLKQSAKSRLVDINIAVDVMRHAYTDAIDVVYLFSGDGDFLQLVEDVMRSGKKVCLGAFSSGLESSLRSAVDRFVLLDELFFRPEPPPARNANA
jgi:uncharacterized LabA/DUF88 family protein